MKKLITLLLLSALLLGCEKDSPEPCKPRMEVYDRFEMPKVDVN